jgi:hypothetical protein
LVSTERLISDSTSITSTRAPATGFPSASRTRPVTTSACWAAAGPAKAKQSANAPRSARELEYRLIGFLGGRQS